MEDVTNVGSRNGESGVNQLAECQHHWMIAPPTGPTSSGVCRNCKEERTFENSHMDRAFNPYLGYGVANGGRGTKTSKSRG